MERSWLISLGDWLGLRVSTVRDLIYTLMIVVTLWMIRWITLRFLDRELGDDVQRKYFARRTVTYTMTAVGFLLVEGLWFSGLRNLGTFLGLL